MSGPPFDPRSVANLMLEVAAEGGIDVTNLALQKLLYFTHAIYLIENKIPLVSGYFEAWQYGPVHPVAYKAFRHAGSSSINFRATERDPQTGVRSQVAEPNDAVVRFHVTRVLNSYGRLSPGRLVDVSHAKGSPWHFIVDKARTSVALGLRIPDNVIVERFKHHKVSVGDAPAAGEPGEDTPFA